MSRLIIQEFLSPMDPSVPSSFLISCLCYSRQSFSDWRSCGFSEFQEWWSRRVAEGVYKRWPVSQPQWFIHPHTSHWSEVPQNCSCFLWKLYVRLWWMEGSSRPSRCLQSKSAKKGQCGLGKEGERIETVSFLMKSEGSMGPGGRNS